VRKAAVQALGTAGIEDAVPLLVDLLDDTKLQSLAREALIVLNIDPDFL